MFIFIVAYIYVGHRDVVLVLGIFLSIIKNKYYIFLSQNFEYSIINCNFIELYYNCVNG